MKISSESRRSYFDQRKNKREKRICQGVLIFVAAILLLCLLVAIIIGCSDQRCRKWVIGKDGKPVLVLDIHTQAFLREFSSQNSELYVADDPNGIVYWIAIGEHKSKTSPGKIKAMHPTGVGVEIVAE